jgi:hypothetical protein
MEYAAILPRGIAMVLGGLRLTTKMALIGWNIADPHPGVAINRDFCDSRHSLD